MRHRTDYSPVYQEQIGMAILDVAIGAQVSNRDSGPLGRVTRFVVDPAGRRLDALVVARGPFSIDERVVDVAMAQWDADGEIFLSVVGEEAERLPPFAARQVAQIREPYPEPVPSHRFDHVAGFAGGPNEGDPLPELLSDPLFGTETFVVQTILSIPERSVVLTKCTPVVTANGYRAGRLHALSLDEQRRVVGLVMTSFFVFKYHVRVAVSSVAALTHDRILLTKGLDALTDAMNEADVRPA